MTLPILFEDCYKLSEISYENKIQNSYNHSTVLPIRNNWVKVFKDGPGKICGREPVKNLK